MNAYYRKEISRKNMLVIACILFIMPALIAQQVVKGRITDATDGTPIPYASILIGNTTRGTISDEMGNYAITFSGSGSFEIVVFHVGFKSNIHKINTPKSDHQHDVALEINELPEVVVTARSNYKQKDVNLFWSKLLGEKPSKNGMEVLNPYNVHYHMNSKRVLTAFCNEPIEIINHHMGYRIKFVLNNFQHNYEINETFIEGMPYYEELIPQDNRQRIRWEKKRREVYNVSLTHFFRALYSEQIHAEGYYLTIKDYIENGQAVPLASILQPNQDMMQVNISVPLILMCYSIPVTAQIIKGSYGDLIQNKKYPIAMELLPQQTIIYPDGTYSGNLRIKELRGYIFGLSSMLPVEYPAYNNVRKSFPELIRK